MTFICLPKDHFERMIDEIVIFSEHDPTLAESIKFIDEEAFKEGITFYDMIAKMMEMPGAEQRAEDWLRKRNDDVLDN